MDFPVGIEGGKTNVTVVKRFRDVVKQGNLPVVEPNEWILDEEQTNHGHNRPNPDGLERIPCMFHCTGADIR